MSIILVLLSVATLSAAQPPSVTYDCHGTLKAYFKRNLLAGSFKVKATPSAENAELAILNEAGVPEFLIHPASVECGCFPDDHVFVTHFSKKGPTHYDRAPGRYRFQLEDGAGFLECDIALE